MSGYDDFIARVPDPDRCCPDCGELEVVADDDGTLICVHCGWSGDLALTRAEARAEARIEEAEL